VQYTLQENNVTYVVGCNTIKTCSKKPFDNILCEFFDDLSSDLISLKTAKNYPDVIAFAFWCRKSNIQKLKSSFEDSLTRIGLGLVFHITPSNVPVNFAFSFAFGLISGNANIVRLPSRHFPQTEIICSAINRVFEKKIYRDLKSMTSFVRYEKNDKITKAFSKICDSRIIWGGDETIRYVRKFPMQERSSEVVFADRYSLCVMDTQSIANLSSSELIKLANNFYNDTYFMDQNACSSPHLLVWHGKNNEIAKELFWNTLSSIVESKYQLSDIKTLEKYNLLCSNAIEYKDIYHVKRYGNYVYRVTISNLKKNMENFRGKYGYFYEFNCKEISPLSKIINNKYQTMTYFGFEKSDLLEFVLQNNLSGVDRIVPIGLAHDMGVIWDGYDIIKTLSRIVEVK